MKQILKGWHQCYYHFLAWRTLLQQPYNHFYTWEFFTHLNPDSNEPYRIYLSVEDYDSFMELLDEPGEFDLLIADIMSKKEPWNL